MTQNAAGQQPMQPVIDRALTKFKSFCEGLPEDERLVIASGLRAGDGGQADGGDASGYFFSRETMAVIKQQLWEAALYTSVMNQLYPKSGGR